MKAILFPGGGHVELVSLPDPVPGPGEVLIELRRSGICGTDLYYLNESTEQRGERAHIVPGHETCGVIQAVGPGVTQRQVGERVVGFHHIGCGLCHYCRIDLPTQCANKRVVGRHIHGSDGQIVVLPEWAAFPLPDDFTFEHGVLLSCNVSTAFSALRKAEVSCFTRVAVFGQGGVGLSAVMQAQAMGARVAAVDLSATRLQLGAELGAERVLNPTQEDVVEELRRWGGGRGVDVVIECSGSSQAIDQGLKALGPHGVFVQVGGGHGHIETHVGLLLASEITIRGSSVYRPGEYAPMIQLIRDKKLPLDRLIGGVFQIEEAQEAFALAAQYTAAKLLFRWD